MGKYIVKRILYIVLVFFILSFLIYMVYNMLPIDKAAEAAKLEIQANRKLNYDERLEYWQRRYGTDAIYAGWVCIPSMTGATTACFRGISASPSNTANP